MKDDHDIAAHEHQDPFFADDTEEFSGARKAVSPIPVIPELGMALGLLVVVFGVTYVALPEDISKSNTDETFVAQTLLADTNQDPDPSVAFEEIELSAHAALVWDVRNQRILYNK